MYINKNKPAKEQSIKVECQIGKNNTVLNDSVSILHMTEEELESYMNGETKGKIKRLKAKEKKQNDATK